MKQKHIHFMGIGGSAVAGVAILAKNFGFKVSGCDLQSETYYSSVLKKEKVKYFTGHNVNHLKDVDILAVSAAVYPIKSPHPEVIEARKRGILMSWQEFQGKYLQKDKEVISIAGTHGKSTTTAMVGLVMEEGGLDPTVEVGAIIPQWQATFRFGQSKYFVCEADEFNNNFLNYSPSLIIINNLEMDHPEFFKDFNEFKEAFRKFIQRIKKPKILILNEESLGVKELLIEMKDWLVKEKIKVIGFYLDNNFSFPFFKEYQGLIIEKKPDFTVFKIKRNNLEENFQINLPGTHLVMDSLAALAAGFELGLKSETMKKTLGKFQGLNRRFDLIGEEKGIKIYDDYAVHPTAIEATLQAVRQKYPFQKIWAIFEPHQYSRLKLFLNEFAKSFNLADIVIVTSIYPGREEEDKTIKVEDLVEQIGEKAFFQPDFDLLAQQINQKAANGDIVVVFGAGKSHQLSRKILDNLK
ncbi:MAG: UDP-N-acetylmuramate--L-alanine ligase [Candidatus Shapirobacteria bacterium]|nr:UDP-N-acetylmuramate--L-alanine ligase [Candidatus Shapirobacteria bacterium]